VREPQEIRRIRRSGDQEISPAAAAAAGLNKE
jgi:hypothetical protein